MNRPPATVIRSTALVVGAAYALALYASGVQIQHGWKQALSYLPSGLALIITIWDLWLWRQPYIHSVAGRPLLLGTWRAELRPTDESHIPAGGNRGPIKAYVVIKQTYWSISVRQYTGESRSDSKAVIWATDRTAVGNALTYTYANTPKHEFQHRSKPHLGTASLDVVGDEPSSLTGYYFTDRYTKGDMNLVLFDRSSNHADFDAVVAHCEAP